MRTQWRPEERIRIAPVLSTACKLQHTILSSSGILLDTRTSSPSSWGRVVRVGGGWKQKDERSVEWIQEIKNVGIERRRWGSVVWCVKSGQQPPEGDGEGIGAARGERGEGDGGSGRLEPGRWAMVNASQKRSQAKQEIIHEAANATAADGGRDGRTTNSYPAYTRPGAIGQEGEWRTRQCIRVFRGGFISDGIRCCSMTSAGR